MHFLGTFESGNTAQFTSATGSAQSTTKKEDSYGGVSLNSTNFVKNIVTDYGDTDKAKSWSGAWFRWNGTPSGDWYLMQGSGAADTQFSLGVVDSHLYIVTNTTAFDGTTILSANTWYFVLVEYYVHDSTGYAKVYINGTLEIDTGTRDTRKGTDTGIRQIKWIGSEDAVISCYLDNCLFTDVNPDWGIKVSKSGKDASSMDSKNLDWRSDFTFLKFHGEYTTSATFTPGDTTKTVSITHGLGYVPAFIAYGVRDDDGKTFIIPSLPYGISEFDFAEAWADTDKIYFKLSLYPGTGLEPQGWNQIIRYATDYFNNYYGTNTSVYDGKIGGSGVDGAMRFQSVFVPNSTSISSATLNHRVYSKGSGSGDLAIITKGIDEDNTADFSSDPMGRTRTTASTSQNQSISPSTPFTFGINVKSQVEEITTRGGWSSGNAMGFVISDNGSPSDVYVGDGLGSGIDVSYLDIKLTGNLIVNFRTIVFKDKVY